MGISIQVVQFELNHDGVVIFVQVEFSNPTGTDTFKDEVSL
jgi:hypothetical protein